MKKFSFLAFIAIASLSSCLKVNIDNSTTSTGGGGNNFRNKQEEIIATRIITGLINNGEEVVLPKGKYTIRGYVFVNNRATLRFAPGSIIVSDSVRKGALIIERNSRLFAEGTASEPIIFTSGKGPGRRIPGDWGGIVLLGNAPTNRTTPPIIEGGINVEYGGNIPADNSGILRFVRIEFAGIAADPNSEINGLTMGGVGSGTTIENVQVSYGNDDAYEYFGGTVNCRNLIAFATADDDYDFDFGFVGRIQFAVALRDPLFVDPGDAGNGVESDNDATGTNAVPFTRPNLSNFTFCGPNGATGTLQNHNFNLRWRRATQFSLRNSILMGFQRAGFSMESNATGQAYVDGLSAFRNNLVHAVANPYWIPTAGTPPAPTVTPTIIDAAGMRTKAESEGCITYTDPNAIQLTNPFNLAAPNFLPLAGSPALAGADFTGMNTSTNTFFTVTTYRGAFGTTNWMTGWSSFTPQTNPY